jgi:hypothetical protein
MFRRRSFLIGCSSLAAAPTFADSVAQYPAASDTPLAAPAAPVSADAAERPALRIAGWDMAPARGTADGGLWVQVNASWQVAWR